jgi:hypothetical protein
MIFEWTVLENAVITWLAAFFLVPTAGTDAICHFEGWLRCEAARSSNIEIELSFLVECLNGGCLL